MNYHDYKKLNSNQKLDFFIRTLSITNRTPEYYVNWNKVVNNTRKFELELNTLNYLVGRENIEDEARKLFTEQPKLLKAIPSLIACREKKIDVLLIVEEEIDFTDIDFYNIDINNIDKYINFIKESGLFSFLQNDAKKSLVDYVYGVETGLDSNARKNRSGTTMEGILTRILEKVANDFGYEHMAQASSRRINKEWGIHVPVEKSERRFDGALFDAERNKVYVFETNYYGGGGSKLKAVAGEFQTLNSLINSAEDDVTFIWVTDGQGWKTAKLPMEEAMANIEHIYNLKMIEEGYLNVFFESKKVCKID